MKLFLRKSGMFLTAFIITNLILISVAFGQRFAVTSGNWNGPIWATTAGGVAGSAATPTAANAVTINVGITVTMNVAGNCAGLTLSGGSLSASVIDGTSLLTIGGNITINNAATGNNGAVISCPLALGNTNRTITVANDGSTAVDFIISGVISGGANIGFTKAGTGTLLLSGNNIHTGITTISAGTLQLGNAGDGTNTPLGTIAAATSVLSGATLDLNGFTLSTAESLTLNGTGIAAGGSLSNSSVTSADYSGLITLGSASSIVANSGDINIIGGTDITGNTFRLTLGGSGNGNLTRNVNNTTGGISKTGTGTWTVSGNSSYTGTSVISAGTLKLGSAGDGTNTPLGTTAGRTTVSAGAVLDLNGITLSTAELLALNGTGISNGGALTNSSATAVDYSGLLSLGSSSSIIVDAGSLNLTNTGSIIGNTLTLTLGGSGNGTVLSVIGTGTGSVTKIGTGTWTLLGTNTYRGATTISTGILKIGTGTNISSQSAVVVNAVLDLGGASEGVGSIAGTGTVTSSIAGDIILSAGFNNTSTTFSGIIENGAATSVGLTKAGTGTLTLAGNNTYTGLTTIAGGRLQLGAAGDGTNTPLGTIAGGTSVSSGATLDLNGFTLSTNESLILNGSGITGGGALSNSSATAVDYNGLITLGSASRIAANAGDVNITGTSDITGNTFRLTLAGSGNGTITRNVNNTTGGLTKTGTGTWTVSGNSTYTASTIVNGGAFKLGSAGDGTNTPLGTIAGRTTVNAGGTLDLNGITISTNEPLTINGIGAAGDGALINSSVTHVNYNSAITLGSASIVGTTGDISLGSAGFIGGQDLSKVGAASLNLGTGTSNVGALLINDGAINSTTGILNVAGDFTNNSIFNNNSGTVRFNGTLAQIIGGTTFTTFNALTVANAAGVSLNAVDATVNGILTLTAGSLSIAGNTLTLNGTVTGAGTLTGSTTSNLTIGGTGALGTLNFDQTTNPVTNGLANLVINRTSGGTVTLGSTMNVLTAATFTAGVFDVNGHIFRLGGTVTLGSGTITNNNAAGIVTFNGTSAQIIPSGLFTGNAASNITIANASGVTFNGSVAVNSNFQVNANSIFTPAPAVVISGTGTLLGNNSNNSVAQVTRATGTSDLSSQYTLNRNLTNLVIEYSGASAQGIEASTTFGGLKISNSNGVNMAGNVTVNNGLNLNTGNLSIAASILTVNGAVTRTSGNLAGSDVSNLTVGGTAGLLYFDGTGTNNFLKNFTVNTAASATLATALNITGGASAGNEGTLAVNGTGVLTTGGFLTIKSNVNGTARIAAGNAAGGYISGAVTVERFIPQNASKAWRLLASNTSGQTINQAWQEGAIGPLANPNPGFGTMIPGLFSTLAQAQAAGFDTLSQGASLLKYDAATDNLVAVPNTNATLLSSEQGYFIYIRGDRSPYQFGANTVASTSTTLRSKGNIFQGDQSPATVTNGQYALLRNPYASAIDLRNVTIGGGLVDAFQVWDPKLAGSFGLGAYQTFTRVGANYEVTPGGGSYPPSGSVVNTIESGAAFFAQATGANGTVQINESSKTSGSSLVFRPSGTLTQDSRIITNLYVDNGSSTILADGNMVLFDAAYSNGFDVNDVRKNTNTGENFGLLRTGIGLVVEKRQPVVSNDTVLFNMSGLKKINYKLEIRAENINGAGMEAFLEDSYKGTQTALNLNDITAYSFAVDANAASSAGTRFKIVFRPFTALPVTFTDIRAVQVNNNIALEWKVSNQLNIAKYEIEKSIDGRNFSKAASQQARQLNTGSITYNWLDENTITGLNYYRIKAIELSGNAKYTEIVKVLIGKGGTGITLSPNVIRGSLVNLQFNNQAAGRYGIRLLNINGQLVYKNQVLHTGGNASQSLSLPSAVAKGIYQLQVIAPDNSVTVQKLILDRN